MELTYEELTERVERLTLEMSKIGRALQAVSEGVPFEEAFDNELFEERADSKDAISQLIVMMHHLLKFRFGTNSDPKRGWFKNSISLPRMHITKDIGWRPAKRSYNKNVVNDISKEYESLYDDAKTMYEKDAKKYNDLKFGLAHLPEQCPWTLIDLVDTDYADLLRVIPAVDDPLDQLDQAVELIDDLAAKYD